MWIWIVAHGHFSINRETEQNIGQQHTNVYYIYIYLTTATEHILWMHTIDFEIRWLNRCKSSMTSNSSHLCWFCLYAKRDDENRFSAHSYGIELIYTRHVFPFNFRRIMQKLNGAHFNRMFFWNAFKSTTLNMVPFSTRKKTTWSNDISAVAWTNTEIH